MRTDISNSKIFSKMMWFIALLLTVSMAGCDNDHGLRRPWLMGLVGGAVAGSSGPAGAVNLRTAATYGLIAVDAITNSGGNNSHIYGNMAKTGGSIAAVSGFTMIGATPNQTSALVTNSTGLNPGFINAPDNLCNLTAGQLAQLQADANAVWVDLLGRAAPTTVLTTPASCVGVPGGTFGIATDLSGYVLSPGIYQSIATFALTQTIGPLVLDAGGNPDAVFIIRSTASPGLDTGAGGGSVILRNGAQAKNVFWVMTNAATIGIGSYMQGTFVVGAAFTLLSFANVDGRIWAGCSGAGALTVTATNVISVPRP